MMKKILVALFAVVVSTSFAASVFATAPDASINKETGNSAPEFKSLVRSYRLLGQMVKGEKNENLGRISQILLDPQSGQAIYVLVTSGGVLNIAVQKRLVPWDALQIDPETYSVSLAMTRDRYQHAPTGTVVSSPQQAEEIFRYYGVAPRWQEGAAP
jgi:hypothetical protein